MIPDAIPGGRPPGRPTSARDRRGDPAGPAGGLRVAAVAHGFPPWPTVCSYPPLGRKAVWAGVRRTLVVAGGERTGREASSSAAILDGRTLRTAGRKKIQRPRGRKAHPRPQASHPDGSRGPAARGRGPGRRPSSGPRRGEGRPQAVPAALSLCRASWPTAAAAGKPVSRAQKAPVILDDPPRLAGTKGLVVIRRRRVVERALARIPKRRRLGRAQEQRPRAAGTLIAAAAGRARRAMARAFSDAVWKTSQNPRPEGVRGGFTYLSGR